MRPPPPARSRITRFFFGHIGILISIVVYVMVAGEAGFSLEGVTRGLWTALGVQTVYLLIAWGLGEHKQLDLATWALYAVGAAAALVGIEPVLVAYQQYFGVLVFTSFAITAVIPLLLGREPFTVWHAVRQAPRWQHDTPAFAVSNRVISGFWAVLFLAAALLCAARPTDPMFTLVYPNLVMIFGLTAPRWLVPLWFKRFPAPLPDRAEPLIMGMPMAFDPHAAGDARALIQFRVSGETPGAYYVRIAGGRCESFEGEAGSPDLTVHVPDEVWVRIVRGELDGGQALMEQRYSAEGDYALLPRLATWFPSRGV